MALEQYQNSICAIGNIGLAECLGLPAGSKFIKSVWLVSSLNTAEK